MSLCGMPYEEADDEYATVWSEKRIKCRKPHKCCECGVTIQPGWWHMYRCAACLLLSELVATLTGECALWGLDVAAAGETLTKKEKKKR